MKMLCITSEVKWFTPLRVYDVIQSGQTERISGVRGRWASVYGDVNRCCVLSECWDNTWRWRGECDGLVEFVEVPE